MARKSSSWWWLITWGTFLHIRTIRKNPPPLQIPMQCEEIDKTRSHDHLIEFRLNRIEFHPPRGKQASKQASKHFTSQGSSHFLTFPLPRPSFFFTNCHWENHFEVQPFTHIHNTVYDQYRFDGDQIEWRWHTEALWKCAACYSTQRDESLFNKEHQQIMIISGSMIQFPCLLSWI